MPLITLTSARAVEIEIVFHLPLGSFSKIRIRRAIVSDWSHKSMTWYSLPNSKLYQVIENPILTKNRLALRRQFEPEGNLPITAL
jgi:hypothetical protein